MNIKANEKETLGAARPQTCARGMIPLDPQLANEHRWNKQTISA